MLKWINGVNEKFGFIHLILLPTEIIAAIEIYGKIKEHIMILGVIGAILVLTIWFLVSWIAYKIFSPVPKYLKKILRRTKQIVEDHNNNTSNVHLGENGEMVKTLITYPSGLKENRMWQLPFLLNEIPWGRFKDLLDEAIFNQEIYKFLKSKTEQYDYDFSKLPNLLDINNQDATKLKKCIEKLICIALDS